MLDFILFENLYSVENHYKDLENLALLLQGAGYKVAIADCFKEESLCKNRTIKHISIPAFVPKAFKESNKYDVERGRLLGALLRMIQEVYLLYIMFYCRNKCKNIYAGSLTPATPMLFRFLTFHKHCYLWGLRSATVTYWKKQKIGYWWCISKLGYFLLQNNKDIILIVSNPFIKKEFVDEAHIPESRIILRPERTIESITYPRSSESGKLRLLTIGTLRPDKHVEVCLRSLRKLNNSNIEFTIAGRSRNFKEYEELILKESQGVPSIKRIDKYLDDEEYFQLIDHCDCLLLCDEKQPTCSSNGTMMEALLFGKPIIAPNYEPFKTEVTYYKIGELYEMFDENSLSIVIESLLKSGTHYYSYGIIQYQQNFIFKKVAGSIRTQIDKISK